MITKIYEMAYTEREMILTDTSEKVTIFKKLKFKVVNYLANKY